jgi:CHAT domain-containing protein
LPKHLPARTAFVDFVRYIYFPEEKDRAKETDADAYAAFVIATGARPMRIELGLAAPVEAAIREWRREIVERRDESTAAQKVRNLVWQPLAKHLPDGLDTVYLSPDGDLARLPFAALPGNQPGTVLLEEFAIAYVPHGPFLLDHLLSHRKYEGAGSLLALGGVRYGEGASWAVLQGTATEVEQVLGVKGRPTVFAHLSGSDASALRLAEALPKARYVHLATHGYFDAEAVAAEEKKQRDYRERLKAYEFREGQIFGRASGAGKRSPLGYVGLVLAGANDPQSAAAPPGALGGSLRSALQPSPIFSGERIAELPLENLRLCVMSACETGLGDYTAGEGVQGLQRAFHIAGCSNVVCSLWNVNDEATSALMRRFYHHLWEKNEPPIQALRMAQLELYRNPTQVADILRGGAPKFSGTTKPLPKGEAPKAGERAATKLWAAFVLSGVGR